MPPGHKDLNREPIYAQLHELLVDLARSGTFKPGDQFLTEREISARYQVSRVTANKALSHLVVSGTLEFRKGVGTFLKNDGFDFDLQSLASFTTKAQLAGKTALTRVLHFSRISCRKAEPFVLQTLELGATDFVFYCERLRLADGIPVILEKRFLPAKSFPGLTLFDLEGSLYELLKTRYHITPQTTEQKIRAVNLALPEANHLKVKPGSAALHLFAVARAARPIWVEDTFYRGDIYVFNNHLENGKPRRASALESNS